MRIGLSYHGGDPDYDVYAHALRRRAASLGVPLETVWLGGAGRAPRVDDIANVDAVLFTGGADVAPERYGSRDTQGICRVQRERDAAEWELLQRLQHRPVPTLGICRGAQLLNVFYGGTLIQDLGARNAIHRRVGDEPRAHDVAVADGTLLHAIVGKRGGLVNSSHHQAVGRLAGGFRAGALSTDDAVIEAFEYARPAGRPFFLAVQWHPEAMEPGLPLADKVLDAFLTAKH
jgi:putative glutamine amidotransferase